LEPVLVQNARRHKLSTQAKVLDQNISEKSDLAQMNYINASQAGDLEDFSRSLRLPQGFQVYLLQINHPSCPRNLANLKGS
jgi:hypothetical protein